jgi:hypothetical protein
MQRDVFACSQSPPDVLGIANWQTPRKLEHCLREIHGFHSFGIRGESSGKLAGATSDIEYHA